MHDELERNKLVEYPKCISALIDAEFSRLKMHAENGKFRSDEINFGRCVKHRPENPNKTHNIITDIVSSFVGPKWPHRVGVEYTIEINGGENYADVYGSMYFSWEKKK